MFSVIVLPNLFYLLAQYLFKLHFSGKDILVILCKFSFCQCFSAIAKSCT